MLTTESNALTKRVKTLPPLSKSAALCATGHAVYRCRSWRCPRCSRRRLAVDFRRIKEAMSSRVGTFWYVVLSFPPTGGHPWRAWRRAQHASNRLLRRASRRFGKFGMIAVWEESAPGRPHLNLVLRHPSISRDSLHAFLRDSLVQCGLGQVFYAEAVESKRAVASYLS